MRNDDIHDPCPQHTLAFVSDKGRSDYRQAMDWKKRFPEGYAFMVENALRLYRKHGYVSANYLVNMVRNEMLLGIKNGLAPAFARIIESDVPELSGCFDKHAANVDGCVK